MKLFSLIFSNVTLFEMLKKKFNAEIYWLIPRKNFKGIVIRIRQVGVD